MREFVDIHETDLAMKLLARGKGRVRVDGEGARVQVDGANLDPAELGEVVRSRLNTSIVARGFGPRGQSPDPYEALGVRYHPRPGRRVISSLPEPLEPEPLLEEAHRVAECPECVQGKHGNCDGSAWCRAHDALELCPCAQADHQ